jgi:hypothetical protein
MFALSDQFSRHQHGGLLCCFPPRNTTFSVRPETAILYPTSCMTSAVPKPEPVVNTVHLLSAVLCADCEVISDSAGDICVVCGSRSLLSLGRVLGGSIGEARAVLISADEKELHNGFTLLVNHNSSTTTRPSRRWSTPHQLGKSGS